MLGTNNKIFLRDKLYIPIETIDTDDLHKHYDHHRYDDMICKECEFRSMRYSDECGSCEKGGYLGNVRTWSLKRYQGDQYVALPIGDRLKIEKKLGISFSAYRVDDRRTRKKMRHDIRFKKKFQLKPEQEDMVDEWLDALHGVIKAPPRTGKTITSLAIGVELGQRMVIVANQRDYLKNFIEELEEWTNVQELERKHNRKIYGWLKSQSDFEKYDIGIITYQSLISDKNGRLRREWINKNFGLLWIDEIHKANATEFSRLVSQLRMKYKGGCTATDQRKDKKHFLVQELIGPVVSIAQSKTLTPKIHVHETPEVTPANPRAFQHRGPGAWTAAMKFLATHDRRNGFIIKQLLEDLHAGRSIVCPVYFKYHSKEIVDAINREWGSTIAVQFIGGGTTKGDKAKRDKMIEDARSGKIRLVCGTRSLLQIGLNVPRWDTHYYIMPMSNKPNWEQESSRILTPNQGTDKKSPIIRMFVDPSLGQSIGCFRSTWRHSQQLKYSFTKEAVHWFSDNVGMSRAEMQQAGEYMSEHEAAEANRKYREKKQSKKPAPSSGLLFRSGKRSMRR